MIVADSMLGKLSRYLRIMGYRVEYITSDKDDDFIVGLSNGNIVLTRDRELHERIPGSILVKAFEPIDQLIEIKNKLPRPEYKPWELCPICSSELVTVKEKRDFPEYVSKVAEEIFYCNKCDKYYWKGSHTSNFRKMMESIGLEI